MLEQETETAFCPDWYPSMQAAKYIGVPWWDLLEHSIYYRDKALIAMTAEHQAAKIKQEAQK